MSLTFYDELGVALSATTEEIKSAYRALCKELHPDVNGGDTSKTERFTRVTRAYDVLSNPMSRKNYDTCGIELTEEERSERCHGALADAFEAVISTHTAVSFGPYGPDYDVIVLVRRSIEARQSAEYAANRADMVILDRFRKQKAQLRYKGDGKSPVINVIDKAIERYNSAVNMHKANFILWADMLIKLQEYEVDANASANPSASPLLSASTVR